MEAKSQWIAVKDLNVWMTIEVRFQNSSLFTVSTILFKVQGLMKCYPISLWAVIEQYRQVLKLGSVRIFDWKQALRGDNLKSPCECFCRTVSHAVTISCFLLINFFSFLFIPQSCSFFSLSHSPHLIFSLSPHILVCFPLGMFLCSSNRSVLCGGTLQCSNHCWVVLLLLHGTVGGI